MGTCTNWKPSISAALHTTPSLNARLTPAQCDQLAADWRAGFFAEIHERFRAGAGTESIDVTHRRVLDRLLAEWGVGNVVSEGERGALVGVWHLQRPWFDAVEAIERLKGRFMVVVLANGTSRLQLDIIRSSGLPFHALYSSQLLGLTKPDPAMYRRALELLQVAPEEAVMVAAHAYDLRAAK
ncbi:HAD-like protein, partial [Aspergillus ellipticus CBS 707.79]